MFIIKINDLYQLMRLPALITRICEYGKEWITQQENIIQCTAVFLLPWNRLFLHSRFAAHLEISLQYMKAHHTYQKSPSLVNILNHINQVFCPQAFEILHRKKSVYPSITINYSGKRIICTNFQMPISGMTNLV
jgi:hypothetical protein